MSIDENLLLTNLYALQFVGVRYKYGGNNPLTGIDCSGLVCEILKSQGMLGHGEDLTAQGLYDRFKQDYSDAVHNVMAEMGCLAFYGKSRSKITHVAYCLSGTRMIEAGGGDSTTHTVDDAMERNAFVRVRKIDYRGDLVALVKPL